TRPKLDVAVVQVEHDRARQTEQHLLERVIVAAVTIARAVAPAARRPRVLALDDPDRLVGVHRVRPRSRAPRARARGRRGGPWGRRATATDPRPRRPGRQRRPRPAGLAGAATTSGCVRPTPPRRRPPPRPRATRAGPPPRPPRPRGSDRP